VKNRLACALAFASGCLCPGVDLEAAEGGSGVYVLGLRSSAAGITPPPGVFFSNQLFIYDGSISGLVELDGGVLAAGVEANVVVNIPTVVWVTRAEVMGARLGFSATTPFGRVGIDGFVTPFFESSDSVTTFGDPALAAFLGWSSGNFHTQTGVTAYLPIGDYTEGALANVARHRLAADFYAAVTWLHPEWGIDISNTIGITFNAENEATNYKTGNEFHWEGAATKQLTESFSAGLVGYYYKQLTADESPPAIHAILGDFKGEIAGIGAQIGYNFNIGQAPVSTRLRYYRQFNATNHLEGDSVFLSLSIPLAISR
jgi:hypothetical protein